MHSTLKLRDSDPHDDFAIAPDVVPAAWADKVLADISRDADSAAKSPPDIKRRPDIKSPVSDQPRHRASGAPAVVAAPSVDTTFRATAVADMPAPTEPASTSKWAKSAIMLVFAVGSAAAAAAWQHHGDAAKADDLGLGARIRPHLIATAKTLRSPRRRRRRPLRRPRQSKRLRNLRLRLRCRTTPQRPSQLPRGFCAVAIDGARSCGHGAAGRAAQGRHRRAQGQPAGHRPRRRQNFRGQDFRGQAFGGPPSGAKSATEGNATAAANRRRGAAAPAAAGLSARAGRGTGAIAASGPSAVPSTMPASMLPAPPPPQATARTEDDEPVVRPPMPLR